MTKSKKDDTDAAPVNKGTAPHPHTEGDPPEVVIGEVDETPTILSEKVSEA